MVRRLLAGYVLFVALELLASEGKQVNARAVLTVDRGKAVKRRQLRAGSSCGFFNMLLVVRNSMLDKRLEVVFGRAPEMLCMHY